MAEIWSDGDLYVETHDGRIHSVIRRRDHMALAQRTTAAAAIECAKVIIANEARRAASQSKGT